MWIAVGALAPWAGLRSGCCRGIGQRRGHQLVGVRGDRGGQFVQSGLRHRIGGRRNRFDERGKVGQEFLDRYFVFNSDWQPPKDYTRTSGLVEAIRKAFLDLSERRRLELEGRPSEAKAHEPTEPLDLPVDVSPTKGAAPAAPAALAALFPFTLTRETDHHA